MLTRAYTASLVTIILQCCSLQETNPSEPVAIIIGTKWNQSTNGSVCKLLKRWWPGTESNRRRQPFQGCDSSIATLLEINHLLALDSARGPFFWDSNGTEENRRLCFRSSAKREMGHARPFSIPLAAERKERTDDPKAGYREADELERTACWPGGLPPGGGAAKRYSSSWKRKWTKRSGAEKGERTASRQGYRSGYYNRTLVTRVGKLELRVPQDRQGRFRTEIFERYQRSEKALVSALTEMYVQGVSTRKVKAITEELCGHEFSASTISRLNQRLDEELERFAKRQLPEAYPYLILDARYEKVREDGVITQPGGDDRHRGGLGGAAERAGGGAGESGVAEQLEGVLSGAERPGTERRRTGDQR